MRRNNLGNQWESRVCSYLEENGMKILGRNYRVSGGEIDIIARDGDFICFVEVKYRAKGDAASYSSISAAKQKRVRAAAGRYLIEHETQLQPRFDAAFVFEDQGFPETEYIKNAF